MGGAKVVACESSERSSARLMEDVRQITLFYVMLLLYQFILLWVTSTALCFYRKDSAEKPDIGVPTRCETSHDQL
jgi:hypothetical protein